MRRRAVLIGFAAGLALVSISSAAQHRPAARAPRVGVLSNGMPAGGHWNSAFEHRLRELGWHNGRNVVIEYRFAEGKSERLPALASELVRMNIAVIVADLGTVAVAAQATDRIPIVMRFGLMETETGLVASLGRPEGTITGVTGDVTTEIMGKRLELLRELAPHTRVVAVLYNDFPGVEVYVKALEAAAPKLGFTLHYVKIQAPSELNDAFASILRSGADSLFCGGDSVTMPLRKQIADFALQSRLPGVHGPAEWSEAGGLVSLGVDLSGVFRRSAEYVDKILRGAKPADLPVERSTRYVLVVNRRTAKALGLTIPASVLLRADRVIE